MTANIRQHHQFIGCNVLGRDPSLFLGKRPFLTGHPRSCFSGMPGVMSTGRLSQREHTFPVCPCLSAAARAWVTLLSPTYSQEKQMTSFFLKFGIQGKISSPLFSPGLDRDRSINVSLVACANCSALAIILWLPYEWVSSYIIMGTAIRISVWMVADILP